MTAVSFLLNSMRGNLNYNAIKLNHKEKFPETPKILVPEFKALPSFVAATSSSLPIKNGTQETSIILSSSKSNCKETKKKPTRLSLSEQLANISAKAECITADIRSMSQSRNPSDDYDKNTCSDTLLFSMPSKCFTIGTLTCRYPSPVFFYRDRCEYVFNHPHEQTSISMIMYYRDMCGASVANFVFKFKLPRKLAHFPLDFDPGNLNHAITIELAAKVNCDDIQTQVLPLIRKI